MHKVEFDNKLLWVLESPLVFLLSSATSSIVVATARSVDSEPVDGKDGDSVAKCSHDHNSDHVKSMSEWSDVVEVDLVKVPRHEDV